MGWALLLFAFFGNFIAAADLKGLQGAEGLQDKIIRFRKRAVSDWGAERYSKALPVLDRAQALYFQARSAAEKGAGRQAEDLVKKADKELDKLGRE